MRVGGLLALVVAAALVAGTGLAATTLESSVESTPDDVVDIDASSVPLGQGELEEYKRQFESGGAEGSETSDERAAPARESDERGVESRPGSDERDVKSRSQSESGESDSGSQQGGSESQGPSDGEGDLRDRKEGPGDEQIPDPDELSLLDRLLEMLRTLLAALVSLLPVLAVLAGLAVAVAHRDRLAGLFGEGGADPDAEDGPATRPAPRNDVTRAWHELARLAGVEDVETTTPRQCATAAVEAGADRAAVERLTRTFEEVRYGERPATEERRERAREALRRAREGLGGER